MSWILLGLASSQPQRCAEETGRVRSFFWSTLPDPMNHFPYWRLAWAVFSLALWAPQAAASEAALTCRIELERGRAMVVDAEGVTPLGRHDGPLRLEGSGQFELAPGSRAQLAFPNRGSLALEGPASLHWQAGTAGEELHLVFGVFESAEVEVRRGTWRVDLGGNWRLEASRGALSLANLAGGGARITHQGGRRARVWWIAGPSAQVPEWIAAGMSVRLTGGLWPRAEPDSALDAHWPTIAWPWGTGPIPGRGEAPMRPWSTLEWPWSPGSVDACPWEEVDWPFGASPKKGAAPPLSVLEVPGPGVPAPEAVLDPELESPAEPAPQAAQGPPAGAESTPEPQTEPSPRLSETRDYCGLEAARLDPRRAFVLEDSPDWIIEQLAGGLRRISVALDAPRPILFFSSPYDYRLFPGAFLLVEADGSVRSHGGWVRLFPARGVLDD